MRVPLLCLTLILSAGCEKEPQPKGGLSRSLLGSWRTKMISLGGRTPDRYINRNPVDLVFYGNTYRMGHDQTGVYSTKCLGGTIQGEIDFMRRSGPCKGTVLKGLFSFETGDLRICVPFDPETERPRSFDRVSDDQPMILTYVRVEDL